MECFRSPMAEELIELTKSKCYVPSTTAHLVPINSLSPALKSLRALTLYKSCISCSSVLLIFHTISSLSLVFKGKWRYNGAIGQEGSEGQVRYHRQTNNAGKVYITQCITLTIELPCTHVDTDCRGMRIAQKQSSSRCCIHPLFKSFIKCPMTARAR